MNIRERMARVIDAELDQYIVRSSRDVIKHQISIVAGRAADAALAACRFAEIVETLECLEAAARGMPASHDNLCQRTLDDACEEARALLASLEQEPGDG